MSVIPSVGDKPAAFIFATIVDILDSALQKRAES